MTVLIPTYNSQDSLNLCIKSCILGCSNPDNIKIIVGDDNISEVNKTTLDLWKNKIEVISFNQNIGLPYMTNMLVSQVENDDDWFLLVNDDNVFDIGWDIKLSKYLEKSKKNKDLVISPNQIEPFSSIFKQFIIKDLGRDPKIFDLDKFWNYTKYINKENNLFEFTGGTLPIFMKKIDFMKVGGWDPIYPTNGIVADVDFFHKCKLSGLELIRDYSLHFYHFVSLSQGNDIHKREIENSAWQYANLKWKNKLKHNLL